MGSGVWTASAYKDYATKRGMSSSADGTLNIDSNQSHFTNRSLSEDLNPRNIIRECCNTEEHPNTLPIIYALTAARKEVIQFLSQLLAYDMSFIILVLVL